MTLSTKNNGDIVTAADWNSHVSAINGITDVAVASGGISDIAARVAEKAAKAIKVSAGTGLTGGGDLSADRTLAVAFGTASGTAAQGNDSRIANGQAAYTATQDSNTGNAALGSRVTTLEGKTNTEIKWTKTDAGQTVNSTTAVAIGSSQSISVAGTNSRLVIIANFDVGMAQPNTVATVGGANALTVKCLVDGNAQQEQLIFASQGVWRGTAGQTWEVTGLSAGSHSVSFTAACTGTAVSYSIAQTHSGATIMVFN